MRRIGLLSLVICYFIPSYVFAQKSVFKYFNNQDSTYNCSLILLPKTDSIQGLVVRDYSSLPDTSIWKPYGFTEKCLDAGYAYLITPSSNYFPELCYTDTVLHRIDSMIHHALTHYQIPKQNVFIGGISASGTRAFKYAEFVSKGKSSFDIQIAGVFGVDPPLDLVRFYNSVHYSDSLKAGMAEEAILMKKVFSEKMGNPSDNWIQFYETAVYTSQHFTGGNASYYMDVPIILFHEPDLDWGGRSEVLDIWILTQSILINSPSF